MPAWSVWSCRVSISWCKQQFSSFSRYAATMNAPHNEAVASEAPPRVRRRRSIDHMWLERGANHKWGWKHVLFGLLALLLGVVGQSLVARHTSTPLGAFLADGVLWTVLIVTVAVAYRISVPRRLLAFRGTDVLFGVSAGLGLRFATDALQRSEQGFLAWPQLAQTDGVVPSGWWLGAIVANLIVAPLVEEFFFRGFLLVALYTVFRRITGSPSVAGVAAMLISTAVFLFAQVAAASFSMSVSGVVSVVLLGLVTAGFVLVTGRLWSAVVAHATFNAVWVLLALVGTMASGVGA